MLQLHLLPPAELQHKDCLDPIINKLVHWAHHPTINTLLISQPTLTIILAVVWEDIILRFLHQRTPVATCLEEELLLLEPMV